MEHHGQFLIYMLNQKSPKNEDIELNLKDKKFIEDLLKIIVKVS